MHKILILEAIPHGLRLDKETRNIRESIDRASKSKFSVEIRSAIRQKDIRRAIAETKPTIVHFCGHGTPDGKLVIEDDGGKDKLLHPEGLANLFKLHAQYVQCVLINTCYSETIADSVSKQILYAVGMNREINDESAIAFSEGFYDALGYEISVNKNIFERAFEEGIAAISLEEHSDTSIPILKKKGGI